MHPTDRPLIAEPADATPDNGPAHRAGPLAWFIALTIILGVVGIAILLYQEQRLLWPAAGLVLLGAIGARVIAGIVSHHRRHASLPRSHDVLAGALGFELHCTCRDVAATVFLQPDRLVPGGRTQLLCFVENYASRRRTAVFRIGPHRGLGLDKARTIPLHLAAGQAAVYALPLVVAPALPAGVHDLPVVLQVQKPAGDGALLPGVHDRLYNLWTVRFAAPFTLPGHASGHPAAAAPVADASGRYVTLASVSEPAPQLARLEALVAPVAPG